MAEIVRMPRLSDTMEEGTVAKWHKKVGDQVNAGDILAEIETDKATMEFESFQDGTLLHRGVEEGETAPVDVILAILGEEGEDIQPLLEEEKNKQKEETEKKEEGEEEDPQKKEEANQETGPAGSEDQKFEQKAEKSTPQSSSAPKQTSTGAQSRTSGGRVKASPLAKSLAKEKGIDISQVTGSGYDGRVVKRDVENFKGGGATLPGFVGEEKYHEEPVSQMRKTIAKRLAESKFSAPHFYLTMEIDMDQAISVRKSINDAIAPDKISFNDLIVKASAHALKEHPQVNASWQGDSIRYNEHVNVGVAVAVEEGLLVPVIRFTDGKSLTQISQNVKEMAEKAQNKQLQPEDWEGNTFTVSNLGMYDIEEFTAIINPPDSCILAVGSIKEKPVVKNGQIVPGNTMKVTLSCDHRVVDGATGSAFLQTFKNYMEEPVLFLGAASI